ncbi:hypothetical protein F2Q68_00042533, partial [Brassica cretica]
LPRQFFNFLSLHTGFDHSTASFCVPSSGQIQSRLFTRFTPVTTSVSSSFDLLIQHYVPSRRGLDGVLVFRMMTTTKVGLLPQVRTLSALLHGLVMEVFEEMINVGVQAEGLGGCRGRKNLKPDVVTYSTLVQGLCKAQEFEVGLEMMLRLSFSPSGE